MTPGTPIDCSCLAQRVPDCARLSIDSRIIFERETQSAEVLFLPVCKRLWLPSGGSPALSFLVVSIPSISYRALFDWESKFILAQDWHG